MGFKSMNDYNKEKYGNWFILQNDGDYADVIFLYRGTQDVMMADTHYIKSEGYSGYVTCCGRDCPACRNQLRIQPKLFLPVFVLASTSSPGAAGHIQFWDRTMRFQPQLVNDVFRGYPNPSEFIFRITRHGVAGDINTRYDIRAIDHNKNPETTYDAICSRFGATFPEYYNLICKEVNQFELTEMMTSQNSGNAGGGYGSYGSNRYGSSGYGNNSSGYGNGNYGAVPRGGQISDPGMIPGTSIPYTDANAPAMSIPNVPLNTAVPEAAPDPNNLPYDGEDSAPPVDPLQTDEDIDMTNLSF